MRILRGDAGSAAKEKSEHNVRMAIRRIRQIVKRVFIEIIGLSSIAGLWQIFTCMPRSFDDQTIRPFRFQSQPQALLDGEIFANETKRALGSTHGCCSSRSGLEMALRCFLISLRSDTETSSSSNWMTSLEL